MSIWSIVVLAPEDRIHPITPEYGPQVWLARTEADVDRTLAQWFDPMGKCTAGVDIVSWLTDECDYDIRITEHGDL